MERKTNKKILFIIVFAVFLSGSIIFNCSPPAHMIRQRILFDNDLRENIIRTAKRYIGAQYEYGGSNPFGFDCSGFTMFIYKKNGLNIPRSASSQYYSGIRIKIGYAKPGDLVFFRINNRRISHVGIYLGNNDFIHSPGTGKRVALASINNTYWKNRYIGAVTYFKNMETTKLNRSSLYNWRESTVE